MQKSTIFEIGAAQKYANVVELEKKLMLKNAYLGAKIGIDTAANELSKVGCAASYQTSSLKLAAQPTLESSFAAVSKPIFFTPIGIFQDFSSSTRLADFCTAPISNFLDFRKSW